MRSHIPQTAAGRKRGPLLHCGIAQALLSMNGTIHAMQGFPILIDQVRGIQFGVHHDRIQGGMPEQRLDHMDRGIVVQMLRSKHAAAIMRMQFQG